MLKTPLISTFQFNANGCQALSLADSSHVTLQELGDVTKPTKIPWSEATKHSAVGLE